MMTQRGFTLVEMLVALLLFALISAAGVALLRNAADGQLQVRGRLDQQAELWRGRALIAQDMRQATVRVSRMSNGLLAPAFFAREPQETAPIVQFVRSGLPALDGAARADLQKLEYRLRAGRLERFAYPQLDGAGPGPPALLVDGIERIELSWRNTAGEWLPVWQSPDPRALPLALRMTLHRAAQPSLQLLFSIGPGLAREARP